MEIKKLNYPDITYVNVHYMKAKFADDILRIVIPVLSNYYKHRKNELLKLKVFIRAMRKDLITRKDIVGKQLELRKKLLEINKFLKELKKQVGEMIYLKPNSKREIIELLHKINTDSDPKEYRKILKNLNSQK